VAAKRAWVLILAGAGLLFYAAVSILCGEGAGDRADSRRRSPAMARFPPRPAPAREAPRVSDPINDLGTMLALLLEHRSNHREDLAADVRARILRLLEDRTSDAAAREATGAELLGRLRDAISAEPTLGGWASRFYGDLGEFGGMAVAWDDRLAVAGRETLLDLVTAGPPVDGCCTAQARGVHPKCTAMAPFVSATVAQESFAEEHGRMLVNSAWARRFPTLADQVLRALAPRWPAVGCDLAHNTLMRDDASWGLYESAATLVRANRPDLLLEALRARGEAIAVPVFGAIANLLPTEAAFSLLDDIRGTLGAGWQFSASYQIAVKSSYGTLFGRVAEAGGSRALLELALARAEGPRAETAYRDHHALFGGIAHAGAVASLAGNPASLAAGGALPDAERSLLESRLGRVVLAAYDASPPQGLGALAALARVSSDGAVLLSTAEALLDRRAGQALRMDAMVGLRAGAERRLFASETHARAATALTTRLLDDITLDVEFGAWLRLVRDLGAASLLPTVERALTRIRSDPSLSASRKELALDAEDTLGKLRAAPR